MNALRPRTGGVPTSAEAEAVLEGIVGRGQPIHLDQARFTNGRRMMDFRLWDYWKPCGFDSIAAGKKVSQNRDPHAGLPVSGSLNKDNETMADRSLRRSSMWEFPKIKGPHIDPNTRPLTFIQATRA